MRSATVSESGDGRTCVRITVDGGTRYVIEQSDDGKRLIVWGPDGAPFKVIPVVGNVIELEGRWS